MAKTKYIGFLLFLIIVIIDAFNFRFDFSTVMLEASLCFCVFGLLTVVLSKEERPVMLFCQIYLIFYYILPGLVHAQIRIYPFFNMYYSDSETSIAALVVLLFCIMFWAGYRFVNVEKYDLFHNSGSRVKTSNIRFATIVIIILIAISAGYVAGFSNLNIKRSDVSYFAIELGPFDIVLQTIARICAFLGLLFASGLLLKGAGLWKFIIFMFSLYVFIIINNPTSLARYMIGAYGIAFFVCFFYLTRLKKTVIVCVMVLSQLTIFPAIDSMSRGTGELNLSPIEYFSTHGDFDGFQSTINVVKWVEDRDLGYGVQLASAVLFFVPRTLWPSKSPGTGLEAAANAGYPFTNISAPMPSELYADFGIPGLLLFSILLGGAVRIADQSFSAGRKRNSLDAFTIIPALAAGYSFILMRGSLISVVGPFAVSAAIVLLSHVFEQKLLLKRRS